MIDKELILNGAGFQTSKEEISGLLSIIRDINAEVIVEIGISEGRSFLDWSEFLNGNGLLVGIDAHNILKWDASSKNNIRLIFGDSTLDSTENSLADILAGRKIDFLRIDGGHDYNTVKNDHVRYSKYVRSGGLIAFHDNYSSKDVNRFILELNPIKPMKFICYGPDRLPETAYYYK